MLNSLSKQRKELWCRAHLIPGARVPLLILEFRGECRVLPVGLKVIKKSSMFFFNPLKFIYRVFRKVRRSKKTRFCLLLPSPNYCTLVEGAFKNRNQQNRPLSKLLNQLFGLLEDILKEKITQESRQIGMIIFSLSTLYKLLDSLGSVRLNEKNLLFSITLIHSVLRAIYNLLFTTQGNLNKKRFKYFDSYFFSFSLNWLSNFFVAVTIYGICKTSNVFG